MLHNPPKKFYKRFSVNLSLLCSFLLITLLFSYSLWSSREYPVILSSDFFFHINRLKSFLISIHNQQYFPRIAVSFMKDNGYSSPMFYSNMIFYPLLLFIKAPFSYLTYYKLILILTTFVGLVITYFCSFKILKNRIVSYFIAILYMTSVFYQYELLVRNALGEGIAMIFLPLVFLGIYNLMYTSNHGWVCLSLAMTLIVYTHLITTVICVIGVLIYLLCNLDKICKEKIIILNLFKAGGLSLLLSASFLLPMLEQLKKVHMFINASNIGNIDHFIKSPFGILAGTLSNSLESSNIGIVFVVLIVIRILLRIKSKWLTYGDKFVVTGIIIAISATNILPWEQLLDYTGLAFIQYPLRLNTFATLFLSIGGALYIYGVLDKYNNDNKVVKQRNIVLFIVLILFLNFSIIFSITSPTRRTSENTINKVTAVDSMQIGNGKEYLPVGTNKYKLTNKVKVFGGKAEKMERKLNNITVKYQNNVRNKKGKIIMPLIAYPGYVATQNKRTLKIHQSKNHEIMVYPQKSGNIHVWYRGTEIQKYSSWITILTIIIFVIITIFKLLFSSNRRLE